MNEVGAAVRSLIFESGKASPEMTHNLKILGGGDMQKGLKRLVAFFLEEGRQSGYKLGERNGVVKGVTGSLLVWSLVSGGCYIVERWRNNKVIKEHEKEGMKILHIMKQGVQEDTVVELEAE